MVTIREGAKIRRHGRKEEPVQLEKILQPEPERIQPIAGRNYFGEFQGMTLVKLKGEKEAYIFVVPAYIEEWEKKILDYGILVAYRRGSDIWREMDHEHSKHHGLFNQLMSVTSVEKARCRDRIEIHYEFMMSFEQAKRHVDAGFPFLTIEERAGIPRSIKPGIPEPEPVYDIWKEQPQQEQPQPQQEQVQEPVVIEEQPSMAEQQNVVVVAGQTVEMWQGRAVFWAEDGKPYHRDDVRCSCPGCKNRIELRSYIRRNGQGEMTTAGAKTPADDAVVVMGDGRNKTYKCPDCAAGIPIEKRVEITPEMQEKAKTLQLFSVNNLVFNDLVWLAERPELADGETLRGAILMAGALMEEANDRESAGREGERS